MRERSTIIESVRGRGGGKVKKGNEGQEDPTRERANKKNEENNVKKRVGHEGAIREWTVCGWESLERNQ